MKLHLICLPYPLNYFQFTFVTDSFYWLLILYIQITKGIKRYQIHKAQLKIWRGEGGFLISPIIGFLHDLSFTSQFFTMDFNAILIHLVLLNRVSSDIEIVFFMTCWLPEFGNTSKLRLCY